MKRHASEDQKLVASMCEIAAERVQYRVDRAIKRDGSRGAAVTGGGMGCGFSLMVSLVDALQRAARALNPSEESADG